MRDASVDLWATDEVHFQQHGSRCQMWIPPETKDPILRHHPTRRSVGYFGAVRLRDGKFVFSRETDRFNAITFWDFMRKLRRSSIRTNHRGRHQRQGQIPPCSGSQGLARVARSRLCVGLPSALQPQAKSDRAGMEAHPPPVSPQPLLRETGGSDLSRRGGVRKLGAAE